MSVWYALALLAAISELPAVEVETLQGQRQVGQLLQLSADSVRLRGDAAEIDVPLAQVVEVRFAARAVPEPGAGPRVVLIDGSRLTCRDFSVQADQARFEPAGFGPATVLVNRVAHVRFGTSTSRLDESWNAYLARDSKADLLVVKKEDALDFLTGVVGNIGEKIGFLLDGDEISVAREKVYGIIFNRRTPNLPRAVCQVSLAGGDLLQAAQVQQSGEQLQVRLPAGPELQLPLRAVVSLDYSAGKIVYLSELKPRDVKYVPFFDLVWEYRRDRSFDGNALTLAGKTYSRGLAIHSKTTLRYRLAGEYNRFQALAGIDDEVRAAGAQVQLVISGDGKVLFEQPISAKDAPQRLELDVAGVRDLEIVVDFGADGGAQGDRLDLVEARLLK